MTSSPSLEITSSRQFPEWLSEQGISLAFTTYQTGKVFLIGLQPDDRLSLFERTFNRVMGLSAIGQSLYLSSLFQLWRFENALEPGQLYQGYDRLYVPQVGYTTGDLDVHDIALDADNRILFVNTLFGCLATVSDTHSFVPLWQPPFLSKLAAEDRCHLNGLAMDKGQPCYVTAISQSDVADGWRDRRHNGGVVVDVPGNQVIATGLSMPHSPRCYQDKLWLLNSGTGYFGTIDRPQGKFEPITFCPGYLRGLAFWEDYAIVGVSRPRHNKTFSGLALDDNLKIKDAEARSGLLVIRLTTGDIVHWLRVEGIVEELYDVAVLPGVRRPMAIGLITDEIRRVITVG
ncbi:MAG: TIGR03032 family protein [Drouetiella hepatica Uher 2000/2452]|jgi:uncharacterized protein (TIGR03032 family)|uniref:TIGR03032 family protein n=1 Tax=Drouetiella hepatica Uher 2000/2452 TaxID=904376 RepID=A0A951QEG0_9CYAN|nr:TIGR03032 family protein [Drouetiella hepatica Uher 2000/2452]